MTQNIERAKSRLNNIQAIEPLLVALRTLSMGTWQTAVNKINGLNQYEKNFNPILSELLPVIKFRRSSRSILDYAPNKTVKIVRIKKITLKHIVIQNNIFSIPRRCV